MELNFYHIPIDTFHVLIFLGQDIGVSKLDVVTQVFVGLSHSWFVRMIQPDVLMVLLDPVLRALQFVQYRPCHSCRGCCKCPVFSNWGHLWWAKVNWWLCWVGSLQFYILSW